MEKNPPARAEDARDAGLIPGLGKSPGGRNDNPLQYSCLENRMDSGAWQATVRRSQRVRYNWAPTYLHLSISYKTHNSLTLQKTNKQKELGREPLPSDISLLSLRLMLGWLVMSDSFVTSWTIAQKSQVSSVHGISQARILEWVAISFFRGSSWPKDRNCISCVSALADGFFTTAPGRNIVEECLSVLAEHQNWCELLNH